MDVSLAEDYTACSLLYLLCFSTRAVNAFELILDERSHRDNDVEWCLICGFVRDDNEGDIPLPHYSIRYRIEGISAENLMDIEELHGSMPVDNLAETEAWLKARESEGYEFMKAVLVNLEGHVIWLRGDPGALNWDSNDWKLPVL